MITIAIWAIKMHMVHAHLKTDRLYILGLTFVVITFLEAHMSAHNVRVINRINSAIMQHSVQKSVPFILRIVPNQIETSSYSMQEGSITTTCSHFVALYIKVMRLSCDFDCSRGRNEFWRYNRQVGSQNSRLSHIKGLFGKLRAFSNLSVSFNHE